MQLHLFLKVGCKHKKFNLHSVSAEENPPMVYFEKKFS